MIGTPEAVWRTSSLSAMNRILVAVVAAIVIAVAEPVGLDTDVRLLALEMIQWTRGVARTALMRFVGGDVILAVINTVAHLRLRDTAIIGAGKFARRARRVNTALLVAAVPTVVLVIALPRFEDASAVVAAELVRAAGMVS